jgi:hypothetical protein
MVIELAPGVLTWGKPVFFVTFDDVFPSDDPGSNLFAKAVACGGREYLELVEGNEEGAGIGACGVP